ncbi:MULTISPECIES: M15 family metallopeptidase [unclassified Gemella]|uniref:M15 family metallopeptidase n=1 Tax=unclassified Gemella TaxID=2624949 RepID=UPI001C03A7E4|nr:MULTISPECIES: M15 family metallopeptidase [unclassified Gemella]MBU0278237.1 M15 family metallopeptidase [Gemella sp. zg-1178]QWQ38807.1 M15 family metallopeptidase [Gemella sp. zg-570]
MKKLLSFLAVLVLFLGLIFYNLYYKEEQVANKQKEVTTKTETKKEEKVATNTNLTPETAKEPTIVKGLMVINKKHPLPKSYNKGEDPKAREQVNKIIREAQSLGLNVSNQTSGFRSYETQKNLYNNYVAVHGKKEADTFSARPGYSEHQSGLAFDLIDREGQLLGAEDTRKTSKQAAKWLADNAHRFGFIIRYKDEFTNSTGYMAEAWHIRYVGEAIAREIYEKNISLEEYLGVEGGDYKE